MIRKPQIGVVVSCLLAWGSLLARAQQPQAVKIEKKPTYIPAGPGQKPFDVTRHIIPLKDIQSGGPPRDGIPALNFPAFISAEQADRSLKPNDVVLGVAVDGTAKAYPVQILNWHEVVNDGIVSQPLLVSW